ncbi:MAG: class II fructose-bisphosphate aldolase [Candidatus Omnitrophica bacterium]|nr:class II fructose-bisphosphate aldolase [Candidatus Omnitrophota bacterium]
MGRRPLDMDRLATDLALNDNVEGKTRLAKKIINLAYRNGIYPSSINQLYLARGKGLFSNAFTVPAINLRTLTYDLAKAIYRVAKKNNAGAFIFEIAKSEIGYTSQPPLEYTAALLAAAINEAWSGPVFIQGDHFQINAKNYRANPDKELDGIKTLIMQAIEAHFYNIDIDSSTLVDLSKDNVKKQQELNYEVCALLTHFIRQNQPAGVEVSVGGEIGEVGGKNSTPEELRAFMEGYKERLRKGLVGISKISIQTGTSHGGVVLPDGTVAKVKLDFDTLKNLSKIAREEFGLAGAVQHGASTLPPKAFGKFPEVGTTEVHLATEFQNMVYESSHFPKDLKERIYNWINETQGPEKKPDQTEEQFIYSTRKKALGPFKKDIVMLPLQARDAIAREIESKFAFLFERLNVMNTKDVVSKYTTLKRVISRKRREPSKPVELSHEGAD